MRHFADHDRSLPQSQEEGRDQEREQKMLGRKQKTNIGFHSGKAPYSTSHTQDRDFSSWK